jgi:hypothetical protein
MKPCDHDSHAKYEQLIEPLREEAKRLGYAIGVHGSLKRDIDLIACPWTKEAVSERELAEALYAVVEKVNGYCVRSWSMMGVAEFTLNGAPGTKPHGRLGWVFNLGGGPYIDLSVMPRKVQTDAAA